MKESENPVSLHIFVSVCISIRAHVYIKSYIHELLIVLMLTEVHGFETSFWLITWLRVALIALVPSCIIFTQALRAGSSNSVLDGSLDGDVSFTNFMNNVVMNITY